MKRFALLVALAFFGLCAFAPVLAHALEVEVLRQAGPADKRFNLVLLGDGYRASDQTQLSSDAKGLVDYVFGVSPFKEYADFFNVSLIHVISNQNGADNGVYGAQRDTALGSYFNCAGTQRLLCVDDAKVEMIAAATAPAFNFTVVIVNDTTYGGSGGSHPTTSINEQSFEIVAHEIAHSLAGLADEYDTEYPGYPLCSTKDDCNEANTTIRKTRAELKWRAWIADATPIPTPASNSYANAVGLFEGARYFSTGVYRPTQICKMRELGQPYCPVCTEQFVLSYWNFENIRMIEDASPQSPLKSDDCEPISLSVTTPKLSPSTYEFTWTVDGKANPESTAKLTLQPRVLEAGTHSVSLLVKDKTNKVRTDPNRLLQDQHDWSLEVTTETCIASAGGGMGAAGGMSAGGAGAGGGLSSIAGATARGGVPGLGGAGAGGTLGVAEAPTSVAGGPKLNPPPPENVSCNCTIVHLPARRGYAALALLALSAACARRRARSR